MGSIFISDKEAKGLKQHMKSNYGFELAPKETVVLQEDPTFLDLRIFDKNTARARYVRRIKKENLNLKKETFSRLQLDSFKHIDPIKDVFDLDETYMWFLLGGAERPTLREDLRRREHLAQPFSQETLLPMITAMAKGLAELQQIGIVHQCVEPRVWTLDFNNTARLTHYRITKHSQMLSLGKGDNKNILDHYLTFSSAAVLKNEDEAIFPKEDSYNFGRVMILMMLIGRRMIKYDDILDEYQSFMAFPKEEKHKSVVGGFIDKIAKSKVFSKQLIMLLENILNYERDKRVDPLSVREYLQLCKKWDEKEAQEFLEYRASKKAFVTGLAVTHEQALEEAKQGGASMRLETEMSVKSDGSVMADMRDFQEKQKKIRVAQGVYEGEVNQKGRMHGTGTLTYDAGKVYQGMWHNGKRNGRGMLKSVKGTVYDGDWKDDKKDGIGSETYPNNSVYKGAFRNNKREGKGKYTYANGDIYDGDWKDGLKHGSGKYLSADGTHEYVGEFMANFPEGYGVETFPDGNEYNGEYKQGKMSGHGVFKWKDGDEYNGNWVDGQKCGVGTLKRVTGYKYKGEWANDSPHGYGVAKFPSGSRYSGYFDNGERTGLGFYFHSTAETYYVGEWKKGLRHGFGKLYRFDGYHYFGFFHMDNQDGWGVELEAHMQGKYRGYFVKGMRHGVGRFDGANGEVYAGEYKEGLRCGYGRLSTPDGYNYEGQFRQDERDGYGVQSWGLPSEKAGLEMYWGEFKIGLRNGKGTIESWKMDEASDELKGIRTVGIQIYGDWENDDEVTMNKIPERNDWIAQTLHEVKKWRRASLGLPKQQKFEPYSEGLAEESKKEDSDDDGLNLDELEKGEEIEKEEESEAKKPETSSKFKRKGTLAGSTTLKQKNYLHTSQPMLMNGKRKMTVVKNGKISGDLESSDIFDEQ